MEIAYKKKEIYILKNMKNNIKNMKNNIESE